MAKSHKGAHKYIRRKLGKTKEYIVWACVLPDCTHYLASEFIIGKKSICFRCGKEFIFNARTKELYKPHCRECTRTKDEEEALQVSKASSRVEEIPSAATKRIDFGGLIPSVPVLQSGDEGD